MNTRAKNDNDNVTMDKATERIYEQLIDGNVGLAIAEMETYLSAWPQPQTQERLNALKEEYELMAGYWRRGIEDSQQQELYQRLLQRLYVLYANVAVYRQNKASAFLETQYKQVRKPGREWSMTAIRSEMENFVSEIAMLELEPENKREEKRQALYLAHQQQMNALFTYVMTSRMWTEGVGRDFTELLLSPTVDNIDQQLMVTAITLSLLNQFDMVKFRTLTEVYRQSQDEYVRQRALVGWVFTVSEEWQGIYPEQQETIVSLLQSESVCRELKELQIQVIFTLNAERDTTTIQQEIMPDILKNNSFRITHKGIEEVEDDPLEDILHPDASEERMEKLENSFRRMMDMQKQGSDIYFGGFSQMKRYPFFYDTANWLVPFYLQHPDIAQFVKKMDENRFVEQLMQNGPFCNSDKYSFVIAFQEVMNRLPEAMREMMKRGEAQLAEMGEINHEEQQSAAYIRRIYLMDLYRFFRLFPNRAAFYNPFDEKKIKEPKCFFFCSRIFENTPLDTHKPDVVRVLKKYRYVSAAFQLLLTFPEAMHNAQFFLWMEDYEGALELEPDNERALVGWAKELFVNKRYEEAEECYDRLLLIRPGKTSYMLNKAVCLVNIGEYDDALKMLYQLNYENADDDNVNRVLAWALTCDGKLEQAEKIYRQVMEGSHATDEDYLNHGYCLWLQQRIDEAAASFRKHVSMSAEHNEDSPTLFDEEWLAERGISKTQMKMMQALVNAG